MRQKAPTPPTPLQIRTFNSSLHPEFGNLRTLTIDGEPWFVGKDVAEALGYKDTKDALQRHVADEDKIMGRGNTAPSITDSLGRTQHPVWINESGLYSLILGSKLEKAKEFKRWVTAEVLPTIRKTGGYINPGQEDLFVETYLPPTPQLPPLSHFSVKKNSLIRPSESSEHRKNHYS